MVNKLTEQQKNQVIELYTKENIGSIMLSRQFGIAPENILSLLHKKDIPVRKAGSKRLYAFDKNALDFTNSNNPYNVAYWLGFLFADGSINKYSLIVELHSRDIQHLNKLKTFMKSTTLIKLTRKECCAIYINSVDLVKKLKDQYNLIQKKSTTISTPKEIPENCLSHFYRGYFDGDGWFTSRKRKETISWEIGFSSGSEQMICETLNWIQSKLNRKCGHLIHRHREQQRVWQLTFGGNKIVPEIIHLLYNNSNECLDRK